MKAGKAGKDGSICFNIYDKLGLLESGGTPFRIVFNKMSLPNILLLPKNFNYGKSKNSLFIFGQQAEFGPVLPINIGSLSSPEVKLFCSLSLISRISNVSSTNSVSFPKIPGEHRTRYGELPAACTKLVNLKIPSLKNIRNPVSALLWPYLNVWTEKIEIEAKFKAVFVFDDGLSIMQRPASDDNGHLNFIEKSVNINIPSEIVPIANGAGIMAPLSICVPLANQPALEKFESSFNLSFSIRNNLLDQNLKSSLTKVELSIAGLGFKPVIINIDDDALFSSSLNDFPIVASDKGYIRSSIMTKNIELTGSQSITFNYKLDVSETIKLANNNIKYGSDIILHSILYYDDERVQISAPSVIRVIPKFPVLSPTTNVKLGQNDIVILTDNRFKVKDYNALTSAVTLLGYYPYFLDCPHYVDNLGKIPPSLWQSYFGKVTLLWYPNPSGYSDYISSEQFNAHVEAGGGLVYCGNYSKITLLPGNSLSKLQSRRVILTFQKSYTLAEVSNAMEITDSGGNKKLAGENLVIFLTSILSSLSTNQKLQILSSNEGICNATIDSIQLRSYQEKMVSECCGFSKSAKICPASNRSCSVRDIIVALLRTDIAYDINCCEAAKSLVTCHSISAIIKYLNANISTLKQSKPSVLKDIYVSVLSSNILSPNVFRNSSLRKAWAKSPNFSSLSSLINDCERMFSHQKLSILEDVESVKDITVVSGFSARQKNSIDLSYGSKLGIN